MTDEEKWFKKFCEYYSDHIPNAVTFKKSEQYNKIVNAVKVISDFVYSTTPDAKIKYSADELIGDKMILEIITDELIVDDMKKFCETMSIAANFEVYPRTDGTIQFNVVFNDAFDIVDVS